ncbi:MAG: helix-turn-helix transcriptional regulator, partial [Burkholderiales bacterium]|nr:helix-turn-helix transcriptional regulator [Burkholderiales bacterium]
TASSSTVVMKLRPRWSPMPILVMTATSHRSKPRPSRSTPPRALHPMGEDDGHPGADGEWLLVLREASEAALMQALAQAFPQLTARESEVLYWVVQGKTNRDIGDILGTSPRTVHKHLEHVFEKLGVETRTAAAGMVMARVGR